MANRGSSQLAAPVAECNAKPPIMRTAATSVSATMPRSVFVISISLERLRRCGLRRQHADAVIPGREIRGAAEVDGGGGEAEAVAAAEDVGVDADEVVRVTAVGRAFGEFQDVGAREDAGNVRRV